MDTFKLFISSLFNLSPLDAVMYYISMNYEASEHDPWLDRIGLGLSIGNQAQNDLSFQLGPGLESGLFS